MTTNISQRKYVSQGGQKCPVCHHSCIEAFHFESDTQEAWREINCNNCGAMWQEIFQLCGYELIEEEVPYESTGRVTAGVS